MSRRRRVDAASMRRFWDARARENAMWYVNTGLDYRNTNAAEFWESGARDLEATLKAVGAELCGHEVVVDIGCGLGRITRALSERAARVIGVDVSEEMVRRARAALADRPNVEIRLGSGTDLADIPDASVDVCYSWVVFQHIPDPGVVCSYIREMGRVLRSGGWALFQVSDAPEIHRPDAWPQDRRPLTRLLRLLGRAPRGCDAPEWLGCAVPRGELLSALAEGGLREERSVGSGTQYHLVLARKP